GKTIGRAGGDDGGNHLDAPAYIVSAENGGPDGGQRSGGPSGQYRDRRAPPPPDPGTGQSEPIPPAQTSDGASDKPVRSHRARGKPVSETLSYLCAGYPGGFGEGGGLLGHRPSVSTAGKADDGGVSKPLRRGVAGGARPDLGRVAGRKGLHGPVG